MKTTSNLKLAPNKDTLLIIEPHEAARIWPQVESYVAEANFFGGGKFRPHHWLARVLNGQSDFFVSPDRKTAAIGEAQVYPERSVYVIVLLGGEGGCNWDEYGRVLEIRSKQLGCSAVEVYGRLGWKKILESRDMKLAHCVWRKELES